MAKRRKRLRNDDDENRRNSEHTQRHIQAFDAQMRDPLGSLRFENDKFFKPGVLDGFHKTIRNDNIFHNLREVEDLRHERRKEYRPDPRYRETFKRHYKLVDGTRANVTYKGVRVQPRLRRVFESLRLSFQDAKKTVVCIRRKARKRVLFALQKIGGRGTGKKRPTRVARWTESSYIRCK